MGCPHRSRAKVRLEIKTKPKQPQTPTNKKNERFRQAEGRDERVRAMPRREKVHCDERFRLAESRDEQSSDYAERRKGAL